MRPPSDVFLGDLALAAGRLGLRTPRELRLAAELLGLAPGSAPPLAEAPAREPRRRTPGAGPRPPLAALPPELLPGKAPATADPAQAEARPGDRAGEARALPCAAWTAPDASPTERAPSWLGELPPLPVGGETERVPGLELEPLLLPRWTRALLFAALATLRPEGAPDLERITAELARLRPLARLPREPWPTLSRGVQVLVDKGEAMAPFGADQARLAREIRRLASRGLCRVLRFAGCPRLGRDEREPGAPLVEAGPGGRETWTAYVPPPAGTTVVLLTDLGIGRATGGGERTGEAVWLAFLRSLRAAGCPAVALVPYPRERWPARLARAVPILYWDRRTSVATVRRAVGRGHRVGRDLGARA